MNVNLSKPASSLAISGLQDRVDAAINAATSEERIVGTEILIYVDGEPVYQRAAGWSDREKGRLLKQGESFRLASVSKLFVSVAAMVLVGKGQLALDEPIETWLPYFRPNGPNGSPARITTRHLLTHTAGLTYGFLQPADGPYHLAGVSDGADRTDITLEENLRRLGTVPLLFEPGTAWNYSLSADVLGGVVEAVFRAPLHEAVRQLVMEPLGLTGTGFYAASSTRLVTPYVNGEPKPQRMGEPEIVGAFEGHAGLKMAPSRAYDTNAFPSGGGGMIGTAGDTLKLMEALRIGGAPLLPEGLIDEMARLQTGELPLAGFPGWGYGLGFSILKDPEAAATPQSVGTWQWGGAYGITWFVDPAAKLSVVEFTNTALEGTAGFGCFPGELCRAVYGA